MFSIQDKVALITGGASGMGLCYVKELLRNGLRGAVIVDVNDKNSQEILEAIVEEFGPGKAIFVKADVSVRKELQVAFEKAIETFRNLDIVINNAGFAKDIMFEKVIAVNLTGTIHGCLLAWEYLPKYRSDEESVLVNVSSTAGLNAHSAIPIYTATKHGIIGLSKCLGIQELFDRSKIRVITVCPGATNTPLINEITPEDCLELFRPIFNDDLPKLTKQEPEVVAKALLEAITIGRNGSFWLVINGETQPIARFPVYPE